MIAACNGKIQELLMLGAPIRQKILRSFPGGILGRQRRTVANRKQTQVGETRATQRRLGARYNNVRAEARQRWRT